MADVVVARLPSVLGMLAALEARRTGTVCAVEVVGDAEASYRGHGSFAAKAIAPIMHALTARTIREADFALYVTDQYLQQRYPASGPSVGVSDVELEEIDEGALAQRLDTLPLSTDRRVVLGTIGSLNVDYKAFDVVMRAMATLRDRGVDRLSYRVLGGGDSARWTEVARSLGVAGLVEFSGSLPSGGPVLKWLDSIDIYVHPSYLEGLPRAVVEAMSRGCPVFGSTAGGLPELVETSYSHPPGDHEALARQLAVFLSNPECQAAAARRSFLTARSFDPVLLRQRRLAFYKSVLDEAMERNDPKHSFVVRGS